MGKRFEWFKAKMGVRQSILDTIRRNQDGISRVSEYPAQEQAVLDEIRTAPSEIKADPFLSLATALLSPEISEKLLTDLQTSHDRFVSEMKKPSAAYPQGV